MRRNKSNKAALRKVEDEKGLQDAWLSIRVNRDERDAFKDWCHINRTSVSVEVKKMMNNLMSKGKQ